MRRGEGLSGVGFPGAGLGGPMMMGSEALGGAGPDLEVAGRRFWSVFSSLYPVFELAVSKGGPGAVRQALVLIEDALGDEAQALSAGLRVRVRPVREAGGLRVCLEIGGSRDPGDAVLAGRLAAAAPAGLGWPVLPLFEAIEPEVFEASRYGPFRVQDFWFRLDEDGEQGLVLTVAVAGELASHFGAQVREAQVDTQAQMEGAVLSAERAQCQEMMGAAVRALDALVWEALVDVVGEVVARRHSASLRKVFVGGCAASQGFQPLGHLPRELARCSARVSP